MDVSRQARAVSVSFGPQNSETGAVWVSTSTQNSEARVVWVSTNPQNSKARVTWVSTDAVGAAKRTGGAYATAALARVVGRAPRHHPVDPSPGMPIAL